MARKKRKRRVVPRALATPKIARGIRLWQMRWRSVPEKTDLQASDIHAHELTNAFLLRKQYVSEGWNTNVTFEDVSHKGPTTAIAIGSSKDWPSLSEVLSRWGKETILRLHVDIFQSYGKLVSYPHVEPDPETNPKQHLDMWRKKNEIRGTTAVRIFREFFTSS